MTDKVFYDLMEAVDGVDLDLPDYQYLDQLNKVCLQVAGTDYEMYQKEFGRRLREF